MPRNSQSLWDAAGQTQEGLLGVGGLMLLPCLVKMLPARKFRSVGQFMTQAQLLTRYCITQLVLPIDLLLHCAYGHSLSKQC